MKFKFTTTPLKDLPLGSVVDGYCITSRAHTGENAIGYKCTKEKWYNGYYKASKPIEEVLLIYTKEPAIAGITD